MEDLVGDVRTAVRGGAWYSALAQSLAFPDICGFVESPTAGSKARYVAWFDREVAPRYLVQLYDGPKQFLGGRDCYALRCAFLHQGEFDVTDQRARLVVEQFHFVVPPSGLSIHNNLINDALQLQVANFCEDVCASVEAWLPRARQDSAQTQRLLELARIKIAVPGQPFTI